MEKHPLVPLALLALFGCALYFGGGPSPPKKRDQVPLAPTDHSWEGVRHHDDRPEADIEVIAPSGDRFGVSLYDGGVPWEERAQADANSDPERPRWKYTYTVHRYPVDFDPDLGAWLGLRVAGFQGNAPRRSADNETGVDFGLRYSPVRFLYGTLAPDILISPRQAGLGVSAYAPAQSIRYPYNHLGIGLGYVADYGGGSSGWTPYFSLSTRF